MKKILPILLLAALQTGTSLAQRIDITMKDKSVISYDVSKIESMEFCKEAEPGEITGHWYQGYRVMSNSTTHFDGNEHLTFNGGTLKWEKSTGETLYDLTYAEDKRSFSATPREGGTTLNFTIITYEPELLVLKRGTITLYFYKSANAAHEAVMVSFPSRAELTDIDKILALKGGSSYSAKTPMGSHFEKYMTKATNLTDDEKAFLADYTAQPSYKNNATDKWVAKTVNLYPFGAASPADVNQHAIGDCCMCAVFASLAYLYPSFIREKIVTRVSATKYDVHMYDPCGTPITVCVDNKVLCNSGGGMLQMFGKNNVITWSTIMEKAVMKYEDVYGCNGIGGIGTEHVAPLFTGEGNSFSYSAGKLFNNEMEMVVDWALQNGMISVGGFNKGGLLCGTLETVTGHAFTVMYTTHHDAFRWSMRNPWGNGGTTDGILEIPNRRDIIQTIDFRLVYPGAAKDYLREDLGGYVVPKFTPTKRDIYVSREMLKMYGLDSYGPTENDEQADDECQENE